MPRRPTISPRNDTVVIAEGLLDVTDPRDSDGNPKYINNATGSWKLIDPLTYTTPEDILNLGTLVAQGSVVPVGSGGNYLVQLANNITVLADAGYYLHVIIQNGSFVADMLDSVASINRSGRTVST
jgi:hypothetical protein